MFDADKKDAAVKALMALCLQCGDKHSDECPLAKVLASAQQLPTA